MTTVNGLWIGTLGDLQLLSMESFIKQGHRYILWSYDVKNMRKKVPKGVIVKDGNEILKKEEIFKHWSGNLATFADIFRYKLLYERGGWWVDLDLVSMRPLPKDIKYFYGGERAKRTGAFKTKYPHKFWIGLMRFPKGDKILKEMYEDMLSKKKDFQKESKGLAFFYGQKRLGDLLKSKYGENFLYKKNKYNMDKFNPLSYFDMIDFFEKEIPTTCCKRWGWEEMNVENLLKGSYTVHLYNKIIKELGEKRGMRSNLLDILEKKVRE